MSGSGTVYSVDSVSDKDGAAVWRLWITPGPGNADARATIAANRTVTSDIPADVAVNIAHTPTPPIKPGDAIRWDAHHVYRGSDQWRKIGFEYDPNAPLSPP